MTDEEIAKSIKNFMGKFIYKKWRTNHIFKCEKETRLTIVGTRYELPNTFTVDDVDILKSTKLINNYEISIYELINDDYIILPCKDIYSVLNAVCGDIMIYKRSKYKYLDKWSVVAVSSFQGTYLECLQHITGNLSDYSLMMSVNPRHIINETSLVNRITNGRLKKYSLDFGTEINKKYIMTVDFDNMPPIVHYSDGSQSELPSNSYIVCDGNGGYLNEFYSTPDEIKGM